MPDDQSHVRHGLRIGIVGRSIVALDPRIGESHTAISPEGGFGGKCLHAVPQVSAAR